jgi:hypothetical protein
MHLYKLPPAMHELGLTIAESHAAVTLTSPACFLAHVTQALAGQVPSCSKVHINTKFNPYRSHCTFWGGDWQGALQG